MVRNGRRVRGEGWREKKKDERMSRGCTQSIENKLVDLQENEWNVSKYQ